MVLKGSEALAGNYDIDTFEYDINNSLVGLNNGNTQLGFDLDLTAAASTSASYTGRTAGRKGR